MELFWKVRDSVLWLHIPTWDAIEARWMDFKGFSVLREEMEIGEGGMGNN